MSTWQTITEDSLREPSAERTRAFLAELIRRACGIEATRSYETGKTEEPREERIVRGYVGTEAVGYRWTDRECLVSSMFPIEGEEETYGIPGCHVRWAFSLAQDDQLGHRLYRHKDLQVRFETEQARALFVSVWRDVFGTEIHPAD